jgi:hypothetical protein
MFEAVTNKEIAWFGHAAVSKELQELTWRCEEITAEASDTF